MHKFIIKAIWDDDVWSVCDTTVPGLAAEAPTKSELVEILSDLVPELIEMNCPEYAGQSLEIELVLSETFSLEI